MLRIVKSFILKMKMNIEMFVIILRLNSRQKDELLAAEVYRWYDERSLAHLLATTASE